MLRTATRAGLLAGLLSTAALLGLLYLAAAVIRLPFVPLDLADIIIRLTPGAIATQGIESFGELAKLSIELAAVGAVIGFGGVLGAMVGRRVDRDGAARLPGGRNLAAFVLALFLIGVPLLNGEASTASPLQPLPFLALVTLALLWGASLEYVLRRLLPAQPAAVAETDADRRVFLVKGGATLLTVAIGSTALAELLREAPSAAGNATASLPTPPSFTPEPTPQAAGFKAPPAVRPRITPQSELYYVASRTRDPRVDPASYRLSVEGNVDQPFELTLDELYAMPRLQQTSTLQCISNEVGGTLIGNCRWQGLPLATLLQHAGIRAQSTKVVLHGADGYVDSISLADALKPTTIVVLGIDGQPLTVPHGYPVRLIVPNIYGMKNVKWLTKIEVVTFDFQGYWQERGWSDPAVVKTTSVVDTAGRLQLENGVVPLGGIAFAGSRGISAVEVQIDEGAWSAAELEPETSPLQWRLWRYNWPATPGRHTVAVRAVDGTGDLQTERIAPPHPDGASGYHVVRVNVAS